MIQTAARLSIVKPQRYNGDWRTAQMATKDPREPFTRIDVKEADDMMKDGAEVVDGREPHEYTAGDVPGAKLIPVNSSYDRRGELPRVEALTFVCAVGQRSV